MKKYKLSAIVLFGMLLLLGSCSDKFLDRKPTDQIADKRVKEVVDNMPSVGVELQNALQKGIYSWMYLPSAGGISGDVDFGQKSIDLYLDILSGDFVLQNCDYGWFGNLQKHISTSTKTANENYMPWRYFYRIIYTANTNMDFVGGVKDSYPNTDKGISDRHLVGQMLGMRAYAYFYLSQMYSAKYDPSQKLVPIYKDAKTIDHPVATQAEVYDLIISDFKKSIELLKDFKGEKYTMRPLVAASYLAYTYAAMGNYAEAEKYSKMVKDNTNFTTPHEIVYNPSTGEGWGFNNVEIRSCLWGTNMESAMSIDLYSWWGQCDVFTYSYASAGDSKVVSDDLLAKMRPDDIRRNQFDLKDAYHLGLIPCNKFYPTVRIQDFQRNIEADYVYLRADEMYMLHIECLARLGKEEEAKAELKKYLEGRIADLSYIDALSGQSLLDEIYLQTRIEFVAEGKSYLAMKRFQPTEIKFGTNRFDANQWENVTLSFDAISMFFKIPENEELNNPYLYVKK